MSGATHHSDAAAHDTAGIESLSKRLTGDLRNTVKALALVQPFSTDWTPFVGHLDRLSRIAAAEHRATIQPASLWDGEEQALRFLLEEGKLTLLMDAAAQYLAARAAGLGADATVAPLCEKFERAAGALLALAWSHKEAIQIASLPHFFELCRRIFDVRTPH